MGDHAKCLTKVKVNDVHSSLLLPKASHLNKEYDQAGEVSSALCKSTLAANHLHRGTTHSPASSPLEKVDTYSFPKEDFLKANNLSLCQIT